MKPETFTRMWDFVKANPAATTSTITRTLGLNPGATMAALDGAPELFKSKPDAALKYVSHGEYPRDNGRDVSELAAYTSVTSLILNLNEVVMKE